MYREGTQSETIPEDETVSEHSTTRPRSRAATIAEASTTVSPTPKKTLSLRSVRRGILNISEASVPAPQRSEIFAEGELFKPDHIKDSDHAVCVNYTPPQEVEEPSAEQHPVPEGIQPDEVNPVGGKEVEEFLADVDRPREVATSVENRPLSVRSRAHNKIGSNPSPEQLEPVSIPDIQVHPPPEPDTNMGWGLGTPVINKGPSEPVSPTTVGNAVGAPTTAAAGQSLTVPATGVLPLAPHVNLPTATLPVEVKVSKRKRVIKRTRRMILSKPVLKLLLGREIASTVHPVLAGPPSVTAVPVQVPH